MRKLLNLYKDCRFLDRLLGTSFFHEDHFQVCHLIFFTHTQVHNHNALIFHRQYVITLMVFMKLISRVCWKELESVAAPGGMWGEVAVLAGCIIRFCGCSLMMKAMYSPQ